MLSIPTTGTNTLLKIVGAFRRAMPRRWCEWYTKPRSRVSPQGACENARLRHVGWICLMDYRILACQDCENARSSRKCLPNASHFRHARIRAVPKSSTNMSHCRILAYQECENVRIRDSQESLSPTWRIPGTLECERPQKVQECENAKSPREFVPSVTTFLAA